MVMRTNAPKELAIFKNKETMDIFSCLQVKNINFGNLFVFWHGVISIFTQKMLVTGIWTHDLNVAAKKTLNTNFPLSQSQSKS